MGNSRVARVRAGGKFLEVSGCFFVAVFLVFGNSLGIL